MQRCVTASIYVFLAIFMPLFVVIDPFGSIVLFIIVFIFFTLSDRILKVMGAKSMKAITRIFGLLVAGFAIQYMLLALQGLGIIAHS